MPFVPFLSREMTSANTQGSKHLLRARVSWRTNKNAKNKKDPLQDCLSQEVGNGTYNAFHKSFPFWLNLFKMKNKHLGC